MKDKKLSGSKLFVFNSAATGPNSRDDLEELFTTEIFERADVCRSISFEEGSFFDGLKPKDNPTILVPGGRLSGMSNELKPEAISKVQQLHREGFHYVGVCAGAYLGTATSDFFSIRHEQDNYVYRSICDTDTISRFGIVSDFKALGPFFPNHESINSGYYLKDISKGMNKKFYGFITDLLINNDKYPSLFAGGCGFQATSENSPYRVLATYTGYNDGTYSFKYRNNKEIQIRNLPAMIGKNSDEKSGAVILSGTHLPEMCVKTKKLINFFKSSNKLTFGPPKEDLEALEKSLEKTQKDIVPLIRDIFRPQS